MTLDGAEPTHITTRIRSRGHTLAEALRGMAAHLEHSPVVVESVNYEFDPHEREYGQHIFICDLHPIIAIRPRSRSWWQLALGV